MSPTTRQDRRRADRTATRKAEERGRAAPARGPTARPHPEKYSRGAGFLNTLIIVLLVVLAVMLVLGFLILNRIII